MSNVPNDEHDDQIEPVGVNSTCFEMKRAGRVEARIRPDGPLMSEVVERKEPMNTIPDSTADEQIDDAGFNWPLCLAVAAAFDAMLADQLADLPHLHQIDPPPSQVSETELAMMAAGLAVG
jgi:hypothetical protein